ncbi:MAG: hypothetical protein Q4E75_00555 [bacterium]|nr:hypothetical protein [bacterium]
MNTSANTLLEACEHFSYGESGTDLKSASVFLEKLEESFKGVNDNLSQACANSKSFLYQIETELEKIIQDIKNNIKAFAESSKSNEDQTLNVLNNVNEQIEAISAELGYK